MFPKKKSKANRAAFLVALPISLTVLVFIFVNFKSGAPESSLDSREAVHTKAIQEVKLQNVETTTFTLDNAPLEEVAPQGELPLRKATIKGKALIVELAQTELETGTGLSGRTALAHDRGMLFVYETPGQHAHWMKGMKIPIDIVWFDVDKKAISIAQNITPETYPTSFFSKTNANYVLELRVGFVQSLGVQVGDMVEVSAL